MTRSKSRALIHTSGRSRAELKAKARGGKEAGCGRKTRSPQAIIDTNRKTEICRNWQKGSCTFEGRCAFAHGVKELKYRTLREMEEAGRIPDASKYRCYPCMTWVATGGCSFGTRCVFIHDPRMQGAEHDWLHASCHGGRVPAFFPTGSTPFFFPDIARDIDSTEVPTHLARYDIDARMDSISGSGCWTAYTLWHSFVSMFEHTAIIPSKEPVSMAKGTNSSGSGVQSSRGALSLLPASEDNRRLRPGEVPESSQSQTGVKHLPVFEDLSRGTPTRSSASGIPHKASVDSLGCVGDAFFTSVTPSTPATSTPSTTSSAFSLWASSPLHPAAYDDEVSPLHADDSDSGSTSTTNTVSYVSASSSTSDSSYFSACGYQPLPGPARDACACPGRGPEGELPVGFPVGECDLGSPTVTADGCFSDDPEYGWPSSLADAFKEGHYRTRDSRNKKETNVSYASDDDVSINRQERQAETTPQSHDRPVLRSSSNTRLASSPPNSVLGGICDDFSYFSGGGGHPFSAPGTAMTMTSSAPSADLGDATTVTGRVHHQHHDHHQRQPVFGAMGVVHESLQAIESSEGFAPNGSDTHRRAVPCLPRTISFANGLMRHLGCDPAVRRRHHQEPQVVFNTAFSGYSRGPQEGDADGCRSAGAGFLSGSFGTSLYRATSFFHTPPF